MHCKSFEKFLISTIVYTLLKKKKSIYVSITYEIYISHVKIKTLHHDFGVNETFDTDNTDISNMRER